MSWRSFLSNGPGISAASAGCRRGLAVIFRSGFPAIGIGIAYPLVVESLLGIVLKDVVKYMPGSVLGALAGGSGEGPFGGGGDISYGVALVLAVVYAVVFAGVSMLVVQRRDVT